VGLAFDDLLKCHCRSVSVEKLYQWWDVHFDTDGEVERTGIGKGILLHSGRRAQDLLRSSFVDEDFISRTSRVRGKIP
jgi:hypothetical protein